MRNVASTFVRVGASVLILFAAFGIGEFVPDASASKGCSGTPPPPPPPRVIPAPRPNDPPRPPGVPGNCGGYGACAGACDAYTASLNDGSTRERQQQLLDALMECLGNGIDNTNPDYRPGWYPKAPPPPPPPPTPPANPATPKNPGGRGSAQLDSNIGSNVMMASNFQTMVMARAAANSAMIAQPDAECPEDVIFASGGVSMLRGGRSPETATFYAHTALRDIAAAQLNVNPSSITWKTDFVTDLGGTPNDLFAIRDAFQARERITIPDAVATQIRTLGDAWNFIYNYNYRPESTWW